VTELTINVEFSSLAFVFALVSLFFTISDFLGMWFFPRPPFCSSSYSFPWNTTPAQFEKARLEHKSSRS